MSVVLKRFDLMPKMALVRGHRIAVDVGEFERE